jgi:hypothetical protein
MATAEPGRLADRPIPAGSKRSRGANTLDTTHPRFVSDNLRWLRPIEAPAKKLTLASRATQTSGNGNRALNIQAAEWRHLWVVIADPNNEGERVGVTDWATAQSQILIRVARWCANVNRKQAAVAATAGCKKLPERGISNRPGINLSAVVAIQSSYELAPTGQGARCVCLKVVPERRAQVVPHTGQATILGEIHCISGLTERSGITDPSAAAAILATLVGPLVSKWNDSESQHACQHV